MWWWRIHLGNKHRKPSVEHGVNGCKLLRTLLLVGIIAALVARQPLAAILIYGVAAVFYYTKGRGHVQESHKDHTK